MRTSKRNARVRKWNKRKQREISLGKILTVKKFKNFGIWIERTGKEIKRTALCDNIFGKSGEWSWRENRGKNKQKE